MTNLLANPFEQIAAKPRVVPVAIERVIQAGVDASYLNLRLVEAARANLRGAREILNIRRTCGTLREFDVQLFYKALDRVATAQNEADVFFAPPLSVPPASVLTEILS